MVLDCVETLGIQGIPDRTYELSASGPTFVTGPAGSGKSSLLRTIVAGRVRASGATADGASVRRVQNERSFSRVTMTWSFDADERSKWGLDARMTSESTFGADVDPDENDPALEEALAFAEPGAPGTMYWFPPLQRHSTGEHAYTGAALRQLALSDDDAKLAWVATAARDATRFSPMRPDGILYHDAFAAELARFSPTVRYHGFDMVDGEPELVFDCGGRTALGLDELSRSELVAVLFAGFSAFVHPRGAIVLVDAPEIGMPPELHRGFVDALVTLGEGNQVVVATTSPSVLRGREDRTLVIEPGGIR